MKNSQETQTSPGSLFALKDISKLSLHVQLLVAEWMDTFSLNQIPVPPEIGTWQYENKFRRKFQLTEHGNPADTLYYSVKDVDFLAHKTR